MVFVGDAVNEGWLSIKGAQYIEDTLSQLSHICAWSGGAWVLK